MKLKIFKMENICLCYIALCTFGGISSRFIEDPEKMSPATFRLWKEYQQEPHLQTEASAQVASIPSTNVVVDWQKRAQDELNIALKTWPKWQKAKNVIYFIGDGMGVPSLTTARIFKAHREKKSVTEGSLSWETFPYTGMIKTYNTNRQTSDSASTATAFICGEKVQDSVICVNQNVKQNDCDAVEGNELRSLVHRAMDAGKWGGIVTTARITHATPAAAYGISPSRYWEADSDIPLMYRDKCPDLARQIVDRADVRRLKVILGGGRQAFFPNTTEDYEYDGYHGDREDGRDLRQEWMDKMAEDGLKLGQYRYVENKTDFNDVDSASIERLFGLFEPSHMKYETERMEETEDVWGEPSLAEMVKKSLDILKRGPEGYFLFVEGGRIDHAHHATNAHRALVEVLALQDAVQVAKDETSDDDTLIIVTADHSHVFSMGGYAILDNDILGIVRGANNVTVMAQDEKPFLALHYANGPGFSYHKTVQGSYENVTSRKNLKDEDTTGKDFLQDTGIPLYSETHGGEDVAIYARGPMAHLFSGQHEQNFIPHAAGYASCIGWNTGFCDDNPAAPGSCEISGATNNTYSSILIGIIGILYITLCE